MEIGTSSSSVRVGQLEGASHAMDKPNNWGGFAQDATKEMLDIACADLTAKIRRQETRVQEQVYELYTARQECSMKHKKNSEDLQRILGFKAHLDATNMHHEALAQLVARHQVAAVKCADKFDAALSIAKQNHFALEALVADHRREYLQHVNQSQTALDKAQQDLGFEIKQNMNDVQRHFGAMDNKINACIQRMEKLDVRITKLEDASCATLRHVDKLQHDNSLTEETLKEMFGTGHTELSNKFEEENTKLGKQLHELSVICGELQAKHQSVAGELGRLNGLESSINSIQQHHATLDQRVACHWDEITTRADQLANASVELQKSFHNEISQYVSETNRRIGTLDGQLEMHLRSRFEDAFRTVKLQLEGHISDSKLQLELHFRDQSQSTEQKLSRTMYVFQQRVDVLEQEYSKKLKAFVNKMDQEFDWELRRSRQQLLNHWH